MLTVWNRWIKQIRHCSIQHRCRVKGNCKVGVLTGNRVQRFVHFRQSSPHTNTLKNLVDSVENSCCVEARSPPLAHQLAKRNAKRTVSEKAKDHRHWLTGCSVPLTPTNGQAVSLGGFKAANHSALWFWRRLPSSPQTRILIFDFTVREFSTFLCLCFSLL